MRTRSVLVITIVMIAVSALVAGWLHTFRQTSGHAMDVADLSRKDVVPFLRDNIPASATDIWYCCYFRSASGEASFALAEAEFLAWAHERGWLLREATSRDLYGISSCYRGAKVTIVISDGEYYSEEPKGASDHIIGGAYDRTSGRAYFWFGFP